METPRTLSERHAMTSLVPETLQHLLPEHLQYFSQWCEMLHLEMTSSRQRASGVKELWCKTAFER